MPNCFFNDALIISHTLFLVFITCVGLSVLLLLLSARIHLNLDIFVRETGSECEFASIIVHIILSGKQKLASVEFKVNPVLFPLLARVMLTCTTVVLHSR